MGILPEHPEIVVLDADGLRGAHLIAPPAVDAAVLLDGSLAATDADSLRGAYLHAPRAPYAARFINLESVVKSHFFWFKV